MTLDEVIIIHMCKSVQEYIIIEGLLYSWSV